MNPCLENLFLHISQPVSPWLVNFYQLFIFFPQCFLPTMKVFQFLLQTVYLFILPLSTVLSSNLQTSASISLPNILFYCFTLFLPRRLISWQAFLCSSLRLMFISLNSSVELLITKSREKGIWRLFTILSSLLCGGLFSLGKFPANSNLCMKWLQANRVGKVPLN